MPVGPSGGDPQVVGSSSAYVVMLCKSQDSEGRLALHRLKVLSPALSELLRFGKEVYLVVLLLLGRKMLFVCMSAICVPQEPIQEKLTLPIQSSSRSITVSSTLLSPTPTPTEYIRKEILECMRGVWTSFLPLRCHSLLPPQDSNTRIRRNVSTGKLRSLVPQTHRREISTISMNCRIRASVLKPTFSYEAHSTGKNCLLLNVPPNHYYPFPTILRTV
nr:hypothetical transcript [Hymenolepis microstoma]